MKFYRFGFSYLPLIFASCLLSLSAPTFSGTAKEDNQEGLQLLADGYKSSNQTQMNRGMALLESAAARGYGEAAYTIATFYGGVVIPAKKDDVKFCTWSMRAANLKYLDAYTNVIVCNLRENRRGSEIETFDKDVIPWLKRIADEDPDWEAAKRGNVRKTIQELVGKMKAFNEK
jgi:hypothetical protein